MVAGSTLDRMNIPKLKLEITEAELSKMEDFDVCEKVWNAVIEGCSKLESPEVEEFEFRLATRFPEHWWVVYSAHEFELDFLAGGFGSFSFNNEGENIEETLHALKAIGAAEYVSPLREEQEEAIWDLITNSKDPRFYAANYVRHNFSLFTS